jgi:hypothetical protein
MGGSQGRQIAGLIREQHARGVRRVLWVSVSTDLKFDAQRDLDDIQMDPPIDLYPKGANLPKASDKLTRKGVEDGVVVRAWPSRLASAHRRRLQCPFASFGGFMTRSD